MEKGVFTRPLMSPSLICSAVRICRSALGPRMTPMIAGTIGSPKRRIMKPRAPSISRSSRSKVEALTA
jgi:hypothetical protein